MNIIIVGVGEGGYQIASVLSKDEHSVVLIDQSAEVLDNASRYLDVKAVLGDGVNPRVLREADVQRSDFVLALTTNDEANMVICFLSKTLGAKKTVARVRNPEYSGYFVAQAKSVMATRRVITPETLGISLMVNPDIIASEEAAEILSSRYTASKIEFAEGKVNLKEFRVAKSELTNKPLNALVLSKPYVVTAIIRANQVIIPKEDHTLKRGDRVWVSAAKEDINVIGDSFDELRPKAKMVSVLGGEHTGFRLAQILEKRGIHVKLIEPDPARCRDVAEQLEQVEVVQGTGTDIDGLVDEGIPASDGFIAATGKDETNILAALVAKSLGVPVSLSIVEKPQYVSIAESVGVDVAVSPLLLTASRVMQFIRSSSVVSLSFLAGLQLEAVEIVVTENSAIANRRFNEVKIPEAITIGAIVHNGKAIIPDKGTEVEPGDHVVMVGSPEAVRAAERFFNKP